MIGPKATVEEDPFSFLSRVTVELAADEIMPLKVEDIADFAWSTISDRPGTVYLTGLRSGGEGKDAVVHVSLIFVP